MFICKKNLYYKFCLEGSLGHSSYMLLLDIYDKNIINDINLYLGKVVCQEVMLVKKDVLLDYSNKTLSGNIYGIIGGVYFVKLHNYLNKLEGEGVLLNLGVLLDKKIYDLDIFLNKKGLPKFLNYFSLVNFHLVKGNMLVLLFLLLVIKEVKDKNYGY